MQNPGRLPLLDVRDAVFAMTLQVRRIHAAIAMSLLSDSGQERQKTTTLLSALLSGRLKSTLAAGTAVRTNERAARKN